MIVWLIAMVVGGLIAVVVMAGMFYWSIAFGLTFFLWIFMVFFQGSNSESNIGKYIAEFLFIASAYGLTIDYLMGVPL